MTKKIQLKKMIIINEVGGMREALSLAKKKKKEKSGLGAARGSGRMDSFLEEVG
jgi:hypothetical protein